MTGVKFDRTVSAGNILTVLGMLFALFGFYLGVNDRIAKNTADIGVIKEKVSNDITIRDKEHKQFDMQLTSLSTKRDDNQKVISELQSRISGMESTLNENKRQLDRLVDLIEKLTRDRRDTQR